MSFQKILIKYRWSDLLCLFIKAENMYAWQVGQVFDDVENSTPGKGSAVQFVLTIKCGALS